MTLTRTLPFAAPLALAAMLTFHPGGEGETLYEVLSGQGDAAVAVHLTMLVLLAPLAYAAYRLTAGLPGRAATLSRWALVPFVVLFAAWEATQGITMGLLANHADTLAGAERSALAGTIDMLHQSPLLGDAGIVGTLANLSWMVCMVAAAVALRRTGAGALVVTLVSLSALFVLHAVLIGPIALACLTAAGLLLSRTERP